MPKKPRKWKKPIVLTDKERAVLQAIEELGEKRNSRTRQHHSQIEEATLASRRSEERRLFFTPPPSAEAI